MRPILIEGVIDVGGERITFPLKELPAAQSDTVAFCAAKLGVSRKAFSDWWEHVTSKDQCTGITSAGRRCKNERAYSTNVGEFVAGISDRCMVHQEAPE